MSSSISSTFTFLDAHTPFPQFRPTLATVAHRDHDQLHLRWSSRHQRKARHNHTAPASGRLRLATSIPARLARMAVLEYWNISWWVAILFTLGSVVWVVNGFYAFLPFCTSSVSTDMVAVGWTAWLGATIFEAGSLLLIWEAWNRGETAFFGWGLEKMVQGHYQTRAHNGLVEVVEESAPTGEKDPASKPQKWIWFTTDPKYWREIGFLAGVVQLCAASIFWISGFTGLPVILGEISERPRLEDGIYWAPQVIGGSGFIISSALYMLETQTRWYLPAFDELGWHIGFWNFVGAVGFTLCGAFGFSSSHWAMYQSSLSTFWGGWAFLIGSCIQWYEAVNPIHIPAQDSN